MIQDLWTDATQTGDGGFQTIFAPWDGTGPSMSRMFWAKGHGPDFPQRVLGCAILFSIPPEALAEALTSLGEILEFHSELRLKPLPPPIEHLSVGQVVRVERRPDLVISE